MSDSIYEENKKLKAEIADLREQLALAGKRQKDEVLCLVAACFAVVFLVCAYMDFDYIVNIIMVVFAVGIGKRVAHMIGVNLG